MRDYVAVDRIAVVVQAELDMARAIQRVVKRSLMTHETEPLLERWRARSRDALPTDAMLINKHIRELEEALASPVADQPKNGGAE